MAILRMEPRRPGPRAESRSLLEGLRATAPTLDDTRLGDVVRCFSRSTVARGQALLRQGEPWHTAIWIEHGAARLYFTRHDGREFNKNFYFEGAMLCPLTPAMWNEPSLFGISMLEGGAVWQADAAALRERLSNFGHWPIVRAEALSRLVTDKLQREHDLLALDGRQRYDAFCSRQPQLAARVPLNQLASYLGLTDVSLSRIRRLRAAHAADSD